MAESPLSALRQLCRPPASTAIRVPLGLPALDAALGGGLARGQLHELWPAQTRDGASALGFALMLAGCVAGKDGAILWVTEDAAERRAGSLYGPGLVELGIDPARLLLVRVPDERTLLRTAGDVARSPAVAAIVVACAGRTPMLDLTASRRLTLFAEGSGATLLLLRTGDPEQPSAAATRWRVAALPSVALEAEAPGHPAFRADLVRRRGGPPSPGWQLEWRRDERRFAALSGGGAALDGGGQLARRG
jgi:protein ImuA